MTKPVPPVYTSTGAGTGIGVDGCLHGADGRASRGEKRSGARAGGCCYPSEVIEPGPRLYIRGLAAEKEAAQIHAMDESGTALDLAEGRHDRRHRPVGKPTKLNDCTVSEDGQVEERSQSQGTDNGEDPTEQAAGGGQGDEKQGLGSSDARCG